MEKPPRPTQSTQVPAPDFRPDLLALCNLKRQDVPLGKLSLVQFLSGGHVDATQLYRDAPALMPLIQQKGYRDLVPTLDAADLLPPSLRPPTGLVMNLVASGTGAQVQAALRSCQQNRLILRNLFVTLRTFEANDVGIVIAALRDTATEGLVKLSFNDRDLPNADARVRAWNDLLAGVAANARIKIVSVTANSHVLTSQREQATLAQLFKTTPSVALTIALADLELAVKVLEGADAALRSFSLRVNLGPAEPDEAHATKLDRTWPELLARVLQAPHLDALAFQGPYREDARLSFGQALRLFMHSKLRKFDLLPWGLSPLGLADCAITTVLERNQSDAESRLQEACVGTAHAVLDDIGDGGRDVASLLAPHLARQAHDDPATREAVFRFAPREGGSPSNPDDALEQVVVGTVMTYLRRDLARYNRLVAAGHPGSNGHGYEVCFDACTALRLLKRCFDDQLGPQAVIAHDRVLAMLVEQMLQRLHPGAPSRVAQAADTSSDALRIALDWMGPGITRLSPAVAALQPPVDSGADLMFRTVGNLMQAVLHGLNHDLAHRLAGSGDVVVRARRDKALAIVDSVCQQALRPAVEQLYRHCMQLPGG